MVSDLDQQITNDPITAAELLRRCNAVNGSSFAVLLARSIAFLAVADLRHLVLDYNVTLRTRSPTEFVERNERRSNQLRGTNRKRKRQVTAFDGRNTSKVVVVEITVRAFLHTFDVTVCFAKAEITTRFAYVQLIRTRTHGTARNARHIATHSFVGARPIAA